MSDAATATGSGANSRDHHGGRLTARARADARRDAALQDLALRTEAARGAEEEQAPDDVGMIGCELLGDAAAGRRAHDVDPAAQGADRVGVLGRDVRHRHAARETRAPVDEHESPAIGGLRDPPDRGARHPVGPRARVRHQARDDEHRSPLPDGRVGEGSDRPALDVHASFCRSPRPCGQSAPAGCERARVASDATTIVLRKTILTATALGALALPTAAAADVTLQPDAAPAGAFTRLDVRVPTERGVATKRVVLELPPGFAFASYQPVAGWRIKMSQRELVQPLQIDGTDFDHEIARITWTARDEGGRDPARRASRTSASRCASRTASPVRS